MATEQKAVKTPLPNKDWHDAFLFAWHKRRSDSPTLEAVRTLWSLWHLETAGGNGFWNFNFGNMTPGAADSSLSNGYIILHPTGYSPMRFASYADQWHGAEDFIRFFSRDVYKPVMAAAMAGDIDTFSHQLNIRGYYGKGPNGEDLEGTYTSGLKNRWKLYQAPPGLDLNSSPQPSRSSGGLILAGLALGSVLLLSRKK